MSVDGAAFLSVVTEGFLTGGNDEFFVSKKAGFTVVGMLLNVGFDRSVQGGDDTVNSTIDIITVNSFARSAIYIGDVENNFGDVAGGADLYQGQQFRIPDRGARGRRLREWERASTAGVLRGGADVLTGRAGQDLIAGGRLYRMNGGTMTGGQRPHPGWGRQRYHIGRRPPLDWPAIRGSTSLLRATRLRSSPPST